MPSAKAAPSGRYSFFPPAYWTEKGQPNTLNAMPKTKAGHPVKPMGPMVVWLLMLSRRSASRAFEWVVSKSVLWMVTE